MRTTIHQDKLGDLVNAMQLTGIDTMSLIAMIVKAASNARMHKKNCRHFAQHLNFIRNLLEQQKVTQLKKYPETIEPLEKLEDPVRRSYVLIDNFQNRSYIYLLAMGWTIINHFKQEKTKPEVHCNERIISDQHQLAPSQL